MLKSVYIRVCLNIIKDHINIDGRIAGAYQKLISESTRLASWCFHSDAQLKLNHLHVSGDLILRVITHYVVTICDML